MERAWISRSLRIGDITASVLNDYSAELPLKVGQSLREALPSASTGFALGFLLDVL